MGTEHLVMSFKTHADVFLTFCQHEKEEKILFSVADILHCPAEIGLVIGILSAVLSGTQK